MSKWRALLWGLWYSIYKKCCLWCKYLDVVLIWKNSSVQSLPHPLCPTMQSAETVTTTGRANKFFKFSYTISSQKITWENFWGENSTVKIYFSNPENNPDKRPLVVVWTRLHGLFISSSFFFFSSLFANEVESRSLEFSSIVDRKCRFRGESTAMKKTWT